MAVLRPCAILLAATCVTGAELTHEAYVWQRDWRPEVGRAVAGAAAVLSGFAVLAAEADAPGVVRVTPDFDVLLAANRPVTLVVRARAGMAGALPALARQVLADAAAHGLAPAELQVDYDCPESGLDGYGLLLRSVRSCTGATRLSFTALPCWLRHEAFGSLASEADSFVLQVHSLDAALTLCDPQAAHAAVRRASAFGRPFRVALPTYGYTVAVDAAGRLRRVQAEEPQQAWPAGADLRSIYSDPVALAALLRAWESNRPAGLAGVVWYRLPVVGDRHNWSWTTLAALVDGRTPRPALRLVMRQPAAGLVELSLTNEGEADAPAPVSVMLEWRDGGLLAHDALAGFAARSEAGETNRLRFVGCPRLRPAETRVLGWARFSERRKVHCEARIEPE